MKFVAAAPADGDGLNAGVDVADAEPRPTPLEGLGASLAAPEDKC